METTISLKRIQAGVHCHTDPVTDITYVVRGTRGQWRITSVAGSACEGITLARSLRNAEQQITAFQVTDRETRAERLHQDNEYRYAQEKLVCIRGASGLARSYPLHFPDEKAIDIKPERHVWRLFYHTPDFDATYFARTESGARILAAALLLENDRKISKSTVTRLALEF